MMIMIGKEPQSLWPRTAMPLLWIGVGIIAAICTLQPSIALASVESTTALDCAEWVNQAFFAPSPARNEAFVDCIINRNSSTAEDDLRLNLFTRNDDRFYRQLVTGENLPISGYDDCPYLRVAVQSPLGSDEIYQRPMRDLFIAALMRAGFRVVNADASHYWWASSLAMDTSPDSAVWTILVRAVPEIGNGAIQFTTVRRAVEGREGAFSGMQSLRAFSKSAAPEAAMLAAAGIATELLPAAHDRCSDVDGSLKEAGIRLEQLQKELAKEIHRVRRERAAREKSGPQKQLEIEVEG
jgi:hypothetical protein